MAKRTETRAGDAPADDPPPASRGAQTSDRPGADAPGADVEETEADKAKTAIEAGDLADDLADFA